MDELIPDHYITKYRQALLDDVLPFWQRHSLDKVHGGYFTCLNREGKVYDHDKFVWLQCRQVWLFAMLYNEMEKKIEWLNVAKHGAIFLKKHGMDEGGNWYFALAQDGKPLVQPYNIFSDCFAAMAFGQLAKATGNNNYREIARDTFKNILARRNNPKGIYNKEHPESRPSRNFALPMILSNLVLEMEHLLSAEIVEAIIDEAIHDVMEIFYQPDTGLILENVGANNERLDTFAGRLVCPGHGLEAMWFMMDLGQRRQDEKLIKKAKDIALEILDFGWDDQYGGLFYFLDAKSHPPDKLDWDRKLWWVHQEAIIAMLKGYARTGDPKCMDWFIKLDKFAFDHFADPTLGEWFGYLNRRGEVLLNLKGGKWKGCFHTPRFLYQGWQTLQYISEEYKSNHDGK